MTEERYFDVDRVLQAFGNMPAGLIDYGAKMLKPVENCRRRLPPATRQPRQPEGGRFLARD